MNDVGNMKREIREARESLVLAEEELEAGNRRRSMVHVTRAQYLIEGVRSAIKAVNSKRGD